MAPAGLESTQRDSSCSWRKPREKRWRFFKLTDQVFHARPPRCPANLDGRTVGGRLHFTRRLVVGSQAARKRRQGAPARLDPETSAKPHGAIRGVPASLGQRTGVSSFSASVRHDWLLRCGRFQGCLSQGSLPSARRSRRKSLGPRGGVAVSAGSRRGKSAGEVRRAGSLGAPGSPAIARAAGAKRCLGTGRGICLANRVKRGYRQRRNRFLGGTGPLRNSKFRRG